ncbi:MAG: hypothetical protein K0U98_05755 [Deltaproteobacteria bacterium]|nr:hypothetical protein [Deltaproteobacteria bacterium]
MSSASQDRLEEVEKEVKLLRSRIDRVEEEAKEREFSFLRSLRTLFEDGLAYHRGDRKDFPRAAFLGAIFAYLRPRMIIVVGSLLAAAMALSQVWILLRQNEYIQEQARSNRLEAIQAVLSSMQDDDPSSLAIAAAQFKNFQPEGAEVLLSLAESRPVAARYPNQVPIVVSSRNALVAIAGVLTKRQEARLLEVLMNSLREEAELAAEFESSPMPDVLMPEEDPGITMVHERGLLDRFILGLDDPPGLAPHLSPSFTESVAAVYAAILDLVGSSLVEEPQELRPARRPGDWKIRGGPENERLDDALTSICAHRVGARDQIPSLLRYLHEEGKREYPNPRLGDRRMVYLRLLWDKCGPPLPFLPNQG